MKKNIQAGLLTELACQYDFSKLGVVLYAPITTDTRSDFIAEVNGYFLKIQCKSSTESADGRSFNFSTSSSNWNTKTRKDYKGQIDYFYTTHAGQGYLIPIEETGNRGKTLRLTAIDDNNPAISWASDYEIEKVIKALDSSLEEYVPYKKQDVNYCVDCGIKISKGALRCRNCNSKLHKVNNHKSQLAIANISRGELKEMIRTLPFTTIAARYGVSDNAVRKWCDKYNLPRKKSEIMKYSDEDWENV